MQVVPSFIQRRIACRPNLVKILDNLGWLFIDKILRMGVGLIVGVWVARYLGAEKFGLLNFVMALVGLYSSVATFGLNDIVVRDLIRNPDRSSETLGTAYVIQMLGGILAAACTSITVIIIRPGDKIVLLVSILLGMTLIFQSSTVVKYWYESQVQSRYTVWVENGAFLLMAGVRVVMIFLDLQILAFAWAVLIESIIVSIGFIVVYAKTQKKLWSWRFKFIRCKELLSDSWPVMLSSVSTIIYMRLDQVMLGNMLGDTAVGVYSAAVRLSEIWYFVPVAINASLRPMLYQLKFSNSVLFEQRIRSSFSLMLLISIPVAILFQFISKPLVLSLYGQEFSQAATILKIHIWSAIFVFINNTTWTWYFVEGKQSIANRRLVVGLVLNVALNYLMIPRYGIVGAAWATLISRAFVAYFGQLLSRDTIPVLLLINQSIIFWKMDFSKK